MKNNEDQRLLARKQQVDADRRAQAILKAQARRRANATAMMRIANARRAS